MVGLTIILTIILGNYRSRWMTVIMSRPHIMKVIFLLCFFVIASHQRSVKETERTPFELDDYLNGTFSARGWNGSWISDSTFIFKNEEDNILKYDIATRSSELFLEKKIWANYPGAATSISPDLSYVLLTYNVSEVFRHSTTASFTIYDIANKKYYDLANKTAIELVTFAPQGHGLVYVKDNNIYYLDDLSVDIQQPTTVTTVGVPGIVYCGVTDWVYEEEVLSSGSALWFSPSATHLAYAVFHDEKVHNFSYTIYGEPGTLQDQYPHQATIRYPKVGTKNPVVTVYVYDIEKATTVEFQLPPTISNKEPNDYIFFGLTWISAVEVAMVSSNRVQNETILIRCLIDGTCQEESFRKETKGWIEPTLPQFSKDGTKRLEILPQPEDDDRYDHLVITDSKTNTQYRLTYGKLSVLSIEGWNEEAGIIYYSATSIDSHSEQNVYSIDQSGNIDCLTCSLIVDNVPCKYGIVSFSKSYSYYTGQCLGPNVPLIVIQNAKKSGDVLLWEDNAQLKKALELKLRPVVKNLVVPVEDGVSARVRLYLPPNLDENSKKKYPAIVDTYGGPGNNLIHDGYSIAFKTYLVTNREYIYIIIDGRGSGRDGYKKLYSMYRKFATVEIEDQIKVTQYLQNHLHYIDADNTGLWGWSYGGFCTSWAVAKDKDHVFKAFIAVAPVTNFLYYDSIYTERYMGLPTPEDNEIGYNNTDLSRVVAAFKNRNYFVIHGSGDDNVHYQNSMLLVKALELADIEFRQHSYPDENHSLGHVSRHLYHMMDRYWGNQFNVETQYFNIWLTPDNKVKSS